MNDLVNGIFECVGGILLFTNCITLYRDKQVKGVSIIPTAFFMCWGYWNLYFYPSVNCWLSLIGGIVVVTANTIWVSQMIYYGRRHE